MVGNVRQRLELLETMPDEKSAIVKKVTEKVAVDDGVLKEDQTLRERLLLSASKCFVPICLEMYLLCTGQAGMDLPDKFPWIGLFEALAKQGFVINNYPDSVPLPNAPPKKGKSKGIDNLVKPEKLQLIQCLDDKKSPMQFCRSSSDGMSNSNSQVTDHHSYRYHTQQGPDSHIPLRQDRFPEGRGPGADQKETQQGQKSHQI